MDNLPTFSDLTQNKQEQIGSSVKKKERIIKAPSPLRPTITTSKIVKEIKTEPESNNSMVVSENKPVSKTLVTECKPESNNLETTESKPESNRLGTTESKQKNKLESKQVKVTIEKETDGKWMYCKIKGCPFWTRKQVRMDRHEKSHVPGDDKFYQCPECQLKICSLSKLLRHDRKFHTGFKDYECKICEAEVTDIAVHMRVSNDSFLITPHSCTVLHSTYYKIVEANHS